jgi:hypothetical protein
MLDPHVDGNPMLDPHVDGNALAGPLREIFTVDVTSASGRCVSCGMIAPVAMLLVYDHAPGLVARCPSCTEVMLRLVRSPDRVWLDLGGMTCLEIALPAQAPATGVADLT